ncbi:FAD-dependent monooxygenase [Actinopolymorpha pittospori]
MAAEQTSVLVVGGSLTGLASVVFLAWHGVPVTLVERHPDLLMHPRLRGVSPRTVEAFRQVGLEPAVREASFAPAETFEWVLIRAETLADAQYASPTEEEGDPNPAGTTPCSFGPIDQDQLELLLRARARELGADVRFSTELTSFEQDDDGVRALLRDRRGGEAYEARADYLIAADGGSSPVREHLGIEVEGPGALFHLVTALVDADLTPATRGREVAIAYLQRPQPYTTLMAHDDFGRRWVFSTGYAPDQESLEDFTDERVADMVRAAAGLPDVKVTLRPQIPGTDRKIFGFSIGAQVAREYRRGRVFLVGDAAHLMPPTGGLNGNTGVQDAHNLAWKLAAVLRGDAGPELLHSYHDERHATGHLTMGQAFARFGARMGPGAQVPLLEYSAVSMGYQYRSSAVLGAAEDASPLPQGELAGQPGTRAPHVPIRTRGKEISTIDLYGQDFVLLAGAEADGWLEAARTSAADLGVPVRCYRLGAQDDDGDTGVVGVVGVVGSDGAVGLDGADAGVDIGARHGLRPDGALLVRPDGVVAWRCADAAENPGAELSRVLRAVLARG